jgi:hypothetical protein
VDAAGPHHGEHSHRDFQGKGLTQANNPARLNPINFSARESPERGGSAPYPP